MDQSNGNNCACMRACAYVCVCACVRACVCVQGEMGRGKVGAMTANIANDYQLVNLGIGSTRVLCDHEISK